MILHHHPLVIRAVLEHAAETTGYAAAKRAGICPKTVYRWMRLREADPAWPTDEDVTAWTRRQVDRGDDLARRAALQRDYLKRRYLAGGAHMHVDPTGTVRRIRALYAIGWTAPLLADRLGVSAARVGHLASGKWKKVHRDTAARVAALYDELSMTVPRDPDILPPRRIRVHDRQRRQSAAKGWAPPLAWDEGTIDDPTASPVLERDRWCDDDIDQAVVDRVVAGQPKPRRLTRAEATEIVTRLLAAGRTTWEIRHLWGLKPERYVRLADREAS